MPGSARPQEEPSENSSYPCLQLLDRHGKLSSGSALIEPELLLKAYEAMLTTRLVDEKMIILQRQGAISFALSSLGEEACAVGAAAALDREDWVYPQYREAGAAFFRGMPIIEYVDHMFGNCDDSILGRQMPNHFGSRKLNIVTVSSPIATKIPHAAGAAYAMKLQNAKTIALCFFGEGATSEGDFHCGLNFAAVRKAPAIFFCRNNGYAISTPVERQMASDGVAIKGQAYGIDSVRVDGNDFFAVYSSVQRAKHYCLTQNAPFLIEAMTYRVAAHSTSDDPTRYRSNTELAYWQERCPLLRLRLYLINEGLFSDDQHEKLTEKIKQQIDQAIELASQKPPPKPSSLFDQVTFELQETQLLQLEQLQRSLAATDCQRG